MTYRHLAAAAALGFASVACGGAPTPSPEPPATPDMPAVPEAPAPPAAPETPPPSTFAEPAPKGWITEQIESDGTTLLVALAPERADPEAPDSVPDGRVSVLAGEAVVAQRPLGELVRMNAAESWSLTVGRLDLSGRSMAVIQVSGGQGEDYRNEQSHIALLGWPPSTLEPIWVGEGPTADYAMGICYTGVERAYVVDGDTLIITPVPVAKWFGGDDAVEDWELEIKKACVAPTAGPPIRVELPPSG